MLLFLVVYLKIYVLVLDKDMKFHVHVSVRT